MTDVRVEFKASAQRHQMEIVGGDVVIKDYLQGKGAVMGSHFTANGTPISDKLDMTFGDLVARGYVASGVTITIYETIKTSNASC